MTRRAQAAVVIAAALAALIPIPRAWVEAVYSSRLFPPLQHALTALSNLVPFALFDALCAAAIAAFAIVVWRARSRGWRRGFVHVSRVLVVGAAVTYLFFLAAWGLNYRRVPLARKVAFDPSRITRAAAHQLREQNVWALNRYYAEAHQAPLSLETLTASFHEAQQRLGSRMPIRPARPKQTLLGGYFHEVSVSGMTDPFFLETLLAPDLLDVEQPFVIAHEWAHLAGYADESEANFLAWLTCRRGGGAAQYSGALAMIGYVPPEPGLASALEIGPRVDLYAMRHRYDRTSVLMRRAAREGYDTYLKANRVEKGIESYDAVLQLILGTEFAADGWPRMKR